MRLTLQIRNRLWDYSPIVRISSANYTPSCKYISFDKGKPGKSRGRKAMGLQPEFSGHDCQAAEKLDRTSGLNFYDRWFCF
jgi:hypothetical protein